MSQERKIIRKNFLKSRFAVVPTFLVFLGNSNKETHKYPDMTIFEEPQHLVFRVIQIEYSKFYRKNLLEWKISVFYSSRVDLLKN